MDVWLRRCNGRRQTCCRCGWRPHEDCTMYDLVHLYTHKHSARRLMPWLHAPISSSEVLSDVAEPSEVQKRRPRKSDGMCMLISFRFRQPRFFVCQPKDTHQNLGRENRTRRQRVRFPRPRSLDNTLDEEIGACSRGFRCTLIIIMLTAACLWQAYSRKYE